MYSLRINKMVRLVEIWKVRRSFGQNRLTLFGLSRHLGFAPTRRLGDGMAYVSLKTGVEFAGSKYLALVGFWNAWLILAKSYNSKVCSH